MGLRFFADHCVPALAVRLLRDAGQEVFVIKEHIPPDSKDQTVIAKAQDLNAILVSLNGDLLRYRDLSTRCLPRDRLAPSEKSS